MNDGGAWKKLPCSDIARFCCVDWQHEIPVHVVTPSAQGVAIGFENEIRYPEAPAPVPDWCGRKINRVSFDEPIVEPFLDDGDLIGCQPSLVRELTVTWLRLPRRHDAIARRSNDFGCPAL